MECSPASTLAMLWRTVLSLKTSVQLTTETQRSEREPYDFSWVVKCSNWRKHSRWKYEHPAASETGYTKSVNQDTSVPLSGLGTILIDDKCPTCRPLTKDLLIVMQSGDWTSLDFSVTCSRSPWGTYTKVFENFIQTYFQSIMCNWVVMM